MLVTLRLLLRENQRRLRLLQLGMAGVDLRLLDVELRVDVFDAGLGCRDLRIGLLERYAVIAVVDAGDHVAVGNVLVVGDRELRDVTRHFRGDGDLPGGDEGVVGRLKMPGVVQIDIARAHHGGGKDRAGERTQSGGAQKALARLFAPLRLGWLLFLPRRLGPLSLDPRARLARRRPGLRLLFETFGVRGTPCGSSTSWSASSRVSSPMSFNMMCKLPELRHGI